MIINQCTVFLVSDIPNCHNGRRVQKEMSEPPHTHKGSFFHVVLNGPNTQSMKTNGSLTGQLPEALELQFWGAGPPDTGGRIHGEWNM